MRRLAAMLLFMAAWLPAAAGAAPLDLGNLVLGPEDLLPGVQLATLWANVDCQKAVKEDPTLTKESCPGRVSIANPYFYVEPVEDDPNSRNLYPGVNPSTLKNAVVTLYRHQNFPGHFGYVLLNYRDEAAMKAEWKKLLQAMEADSQLYGRTYEQGTQGFFVFREKQDEPQKEVPLSVMEHLFNTLKEIMSDPLPATDRVREVETAMGKLPRQQLPEGMVLSEALQGLANPHFVTGPQARSLVQALLPPVRFSAVKGIRFANYENPAGPHCRSVVTTILFDATTAPPGGHGPEQVRWAKEHLEQELLADGSTHLLYGKKTLHHFGQTGCPSDKDVNAALVKQWKKVNSGLKEQSLVRGMKKDRLTEEVRMFLKRLRQCLEKGDAVCLAGMLTDGKAIRNLLEKNPQNSAFDRELDTLLALQSTTGAVLRDMVTLRKAQRKDLLMPTPLSSLAVQSPVQTNELSLYLVDNGELPMFRTRPIEVAPDLAREFLVLPKEGGRVRVTVRKVVLERFQGKLKLVAWQ